MFKCKKKFVALCAMVLTLALLAPMLCFANNSGEEVLYGDVNGDMKIDLADVIELRKRLAGGEEECSKPGTDVDGNGYVDLRDLVTLRKYFANYNYDTNESTEILGSPKLAYTYTSGDGATTLHYNNADVYDFEYTCENLMNNGYSVYCTNTVGGLTSATYTKDDGVVTVTFNGGMKELYVTTSQSGADALPDANSDYKAIYGKTTITQNYSPQDNGMCYFIKLADGSFIIVDGGYAEGYIDDGVHKDDAVRVYNTLVDLNGGSENIHIRAWLITHSHGDHYQVFRYFANNYTQNVTLDTLLCSPAAEYINGVKVTGYDRYLTDSVQADAKKLGADVAYVRTGMSFKFVDITFEMLLTPEQIYKTGDTGNFNETSVVSRIKNADGSMIFLGDCGKHASDWLVNTYGSALKSDMVQMAHHGCETATASLYDNIAAPTVFWPCNLNLLMSDRGGLVKQHVLDAEYSKEHLLHDYGCVTRTLGYIPQTEYKSIMPKDTDQVAGSGWTENIRLEDGVLRYDVKSGGSGTPDPYVYFNVDINASQYNAIKLVVDPADIKNAVVFFTYGTSFVGGQERGFRAQGLCAEDDDKMTIILYLGNVSTFKEDTTLTKLRIDLGDTVGETIDIYSVEAYYVDVD